MNNTIVAIGTRKFDLNYMMTRASRGEKEAVSLIAMWYESSAGKAYHQDALKKRDEVKKVTQRMTRRQYDDIGQGLKRAAREAWLAKQGKAAA